MTQLVLTASEWLNFSGIADYFRTLKAKAEYRAKVRETIKELSQLSDAELRDLGIGRGEIYDIAHSSFKDEYNDYIKKVNSNLEGWV